MDDKRKIFACTRFLDSGPAKKECRVFFEAAAPPLPRSRDLPARCGRPALNVAADASARHTFRVSTTHSLLCICPALASQTPTATDSSVCVVGVVLVGADVGPYMADTTHMGESSPRICVCTAHQPVSGATMPVTNARYTSETHTDTPKPFTPPGG